MLHNSILRKVIYLLHLYIGIILGLLITLICLSGTAIVYKPELEKLSVKDIAFVKPTSQTVPLQTLLENVRLEYPQAKINNLVLYGGKNCAYSFRTTFPDEKGRIQIYVNPYTGKVTGVDRYRYKIFQWLYDFHVNLLWKKNGAMIVSLSGFFLIFLTVSGFLLLPKRHIFSFHRRMGLRARLFKSHSIIGICTSIFLLAIAFTGSYFGFKKEYQSFFESISAGKAIVPAPKVDKYTGNWVPLDSVLATAQEKFKDGTPTMIFFPKDDTSVFSVRMHQKWDFERTGSNHIYIHPTTGKIIATNLWKDKPAAEKLVRSMYFIHFGTFLGHFSRILWILISLTVPFLYFTGFYIWVIRNRQQHYPSREHKSSKSHFA